VSQQLCSDGSLVELKEDLGTICVRDRLDVALEPGPVAAQTRPGRVVSLTWMKGDFLSRSWSAILPPR